MHYSFTHQFVKKNKNTALNTVLLLACICFWAITIQAQQIAFPSAEGAGRFTTGGRGTPTIPTTVFEVTNLSDDNTVGSLRYALQASATTYPYKTIVFRVSGTIHLTSKLNIRGNTTIAGQTAPGGGICIADHPVVISGDNVIVRYIRIRMGDKNQNKGKVDGSGGDDAFGNLGNKNIIIDHCSISWSSDEALTIYRGDSISVQWNIVSEPLNYSYHYEDPGPDFQEHGYGGIWGGKRASFHHNLIAHAKGRLPRFSGSSTYTPNTAGTENVDFRNNVIYNWGIYSTNGGDGGNYNIVNNYYKYGPSTSTGTSSGVAIKNQLMNPSISTNLPYPKIYLIGNYMDGSPTVTDRNWMGVSMSNGTQADTTQSKVLIPFDVSTLNTQSATDAYQSVLLSAGAILPVRDTLDERIVNDVKNRTGRFIDVQGGFPHGTAYDLTVNAWPNLISNAAPTDTDHDGMPDQWETANGFNHNDATDRNGYAANGYTNLENYINNIINTTPVIAINSNLNAFTQTLGSPSTAQSYTLSGNNLSGNITITPPVGYEVSVNGATWFNNALPLNLTAVSGVIANTTIQLRLNAVAVGSYGGNILHASTGANSVTVPVSGVAASANNGNRVVLQWWPMTTANTDSSSVRSAGVQPTTPTFSNFAISNGVTVPALLPYSGLYGQVFAATSDGFWTTASGGPGGNLNRKNYEQFLIVAANSYSVRVDSILFKTAFYASASNTKLAIVYSKTGFRTNDSTEVTAASFTTPQVLLQQNAGPAAAYAFALNGLNGVTLNTNDTLSIRLYFSCGSTSSGRYAMLKDVTVSGVATSIAAALIETSGTLNAFAQTVGTPSAVQNYSVKGSNLAGNITVTAPVGYQISLDGTNWNGNATPLTITAVNGTVASTPISVRLNAATAATYTGNITHVSVGASTLNVMLNGVATSSVTYPYNADVMVAKDGTGNYTTIQAAIDAAPTSRTTPYVIYIKNGIYKEKVNIPVNKPFVHLIGESAANTVITWDDYSGKIVNSVTIGTSTSATVTINATDCMAMNITFENSTGYSGDGPQALAINVSGDRCAFKNCRFIGGQDTVLANGNGKRQYFKNCYIDGNTDFIFGSSTVIFDTCVIFPRDRVDGANGGYVTACNTPAGQAYGYVFRDCKITMNKAVTLYTLGRPWQNDAGTADAAKSNTKTVFLNTMMGTSIKPEGWSTWDAGTNTSLITYAEYKTRKYDGSLVNVSSRVAWSKQLSDAEAASYYSDATVLNGWDPCTLSTFLCGTNTTELAVSNMRVQRTSNKSILSWNLSWPMPGVKYELYRSTDSLNFVKVNEVTGAIDTVVAFSVNDALPALGTTYYYYVLATKAGMAPYKTYIVSVNIHTPLDGDYRSAGSGFWTNASGTGYASNTVSIWEKYKASTATWELQPLATAPNGVNVTIRSGHAVILDALKNCNNLVVESGAILKSNGGSAGTASQTLRVGAGTAADVVIKNDGLIGGNANPDDLITLEFTTSCNSVLITGSGIAKITRLRPLYPNTNTLVVTFNQDMTLSYNSGGFTAYYNNAANTSTENVTYTINAGKTIKLTNAAGSFNATPNPTPNPGGKYTYNIYGTLDLSTTTTVSNAVPFSNNAASVLSINVAGKGLLKLGAGFNTVNSSPGTANGKVVLTIADSAMVDATKTTYLNLGSNYFITSGAGSLKRAVGSTAMLFPIGISATSYNPVTISNTGTADNFSVSVKNSFDKAPASPTQVANLQWFITEEIPGATIADIKLGWLTENNAAAFIPTQDVSIMRYNGTAWENTLATVTGTGVLADSYIASASGFTAFNAFGVTNTKPGIVATGTLNNFTQIVGSPSASQNIVVSGINLNDNIVLTPSSNYELSVDGGITWSKTPITLVKTGSGVNATTVAIRLNAATIGTYAGTIIATSNGAVTVTITINGATTPAPFLTLTAALTAFTQVLGTPSSIQTYTISGSNLTGNVTITPPANYEVSANGGISWFTNTVPLVIVPVNNALAVTTISVRLNATAIGSYAGNITNISVGATSSNVAISGIVIPMPAIAIVSTLSAFQQTIGTASVVQTYALIGSNLNSSITVTPPANYEVSVNGGINWHTATSPLIIAPTSGALNANISVRLNAVVAGTYTGNILHLTTGATPVNITVTGTAVNAPALTIISALNPFSQTLGTASTAQSFTVQGNYLTGTLTVTPPLGYQLSLNNLNWFDNAIPLVLTPSSSGTVTITNVLIRLNATITGLHHDNVIVKTNGTTDQLIEVAGYTYKPMTIAPNPSSEVITLYHQQLFAAGDIYITDMSGKIVRSMRSTVASGSTKINISTLPAGVYQLEFRRNGEIGSFRFIKL